jgi:nucleoside-diphosphate-sugar epimerase
MRILVTGSRGYIGYVLCDRLARRGHDVVGLDAGYFAGCTIGDAAIRWEERIADVRDAEPGDLWGVDAVAHLAGLSNDPLGSLDPDLTRRINLEGTLRLARTARDAGVGRFLFSSSCSIYGRQGDDALTEQAPMAPLTPYAHSKVDAEAGLRELATRSFSPVFLRNATAYGWSPYLRFDLVLNNFVGWALATGAVRVLSDGMAIRPLVHVDDISDAFIAAAEAPREAVHSQAFNVGRDDENHRIRDLAYAVRDALPGTEVTFADGGGPDSRSYRVSFAKIRELLPAFDPRWDARRGAEQVAARLRSLPSPRETFEDPRFTRLAHLRALLDEGRLDRELRWTAAATPA